jgi:hypothetical protein
LVTREKGYKAFLNYIQKLITGDLDEIRASVDESDLDAVDNLKNSDIPLTTLTDAQKRRKIIEDFESGKLEPNKKADGSKRKLGDETRTSNYAEMKIDDYFETQTFRIGGNIGSLKRISLNTVKSLDDSFMKGIDGIYEFSTPPPKYIISEVKYNTAKLSKNVTNSGGIQMSELWIEYDLRKGAVSPELRRDILAKGYEPILCQVGKDGKVSIQTIEQTLTSAKKGSNWNGIAL